MPLYLSIYVEILKQSKCQNGPDVWRGREYSNVCKGNYLMCLTPSPFGFCLSGFGWRAAIRPADHPVANFEFDVVVGADGRRNTLEGEKTVNKRGVKNTGASRMYFILPTKYIMKLPVSVPGSKKQ